MEMRIRIPKNYDLGSLRAKCCILSVAYVLTQEDFPTKLRSGAFGRLDCFDRFDRFYQRLV